MEEHSLLQVDSFQYQEIVDDDPAVAAWMGLFLAETTVDHLIPPPEYYRTPMNPPWTVDLVRRAAVDAPKVRTTTLYEAMAYLEKRLDEPWLVRRYRRELAGISALRRRRVRAFKTDGARVRLFSGRHRRDESRATAATGNPRESRNSNDEPRE